MPASLAERRAFLLAIFRSDMLHRSYIQEKVELALSPGVSAATLRGALDSGNQARYDGFLEATVA